MEHSKKHEILSAVLLIITITASMILTFICVTLYTKINDLHSETKKLEKSIQSLSASSEESVLEEDIFILKEYNGYIGVFDKSSVLMDVINVQIKSLPEADRNMLRTGIYAFSRNELISLIEDYTG